MKSGYKGTDISVDELYFKSPIKVYCIPIMIMMKAGLPVSFSSKRRNLEAYLF